MMQEKRSAHISEKGFTLLEMMVAITLVAMMAAGIWSVFGTSLRAWSRGTEYIDASQRQRNILDMVRKQLASAYPLTAPPDPDAAAIPNPIFQGTETSLRFVSLNSLRFQDSPGLTLVNYQVTQDSDGAFTLQEIEERYLGSLTDSESDIENSGATPLFGNLIQCYFEYRSNDENEDPWIREWDAQERGQLPEAIAVTMEVLGPDGNRRNNHIVVPIHATQGTLQGNILNQSIIRNAIREERMRGMEAGGAVERGFEGSRFEGRPERKPGMPARKPGAPGREFIGGPGTGPGMERNEELRELLRRRLEREQGR